MRNYLLTALLILVFLPSHAAEIREVEGDELKSFLRSVEVLIDKHNPDDFPAILRLVTAWTPSERCAPAVKAEEGCHESKLYLVLSNWDLYPNLQVFEVGSASRWRVKDLSLNEGAKHSLWTARLKLEADVYVDDRETVRSIELKISDTHDQYSVDLLSEK